jgi:hypothetical protein
MRPQAEVRHDPGLPDRPLDPGLGVADILTGSRHPTIEIGRPHGAPLARGAKSLSAGSKAKAGTDRAREEGFLAYPLAYPLRQDGAWDNREVCRQDFGRAPRQFKLAPILSCLAQQPKGAE